VNNTVNTFVSGRAGEDKAAAYLENAGLSIIARNFRGRGGEIDLIALEGGTNPADLGAKPAAWPMEGLQGENSRLCPAGAAPQTLVFVEVKSWTAMDFENLEYSINAKKQKKIIETAKFFLQKHREYSEAAVRFDVVFVNADTITHLASAFTESV
jgi:putative endonuclease